MICDQSQIPLLQILFGCAECLNRADTAAKVSPLSTAFYYPVFRLRSSPTERAWEHLRTEHFISIALHGPALGFSISFSLRPALASGERYLAIFRAVFLVEPRS